MRKVTKTKLIYMFHELSEEAKERAIGNEREVTLDYEWWEWILEDLQEQCAKLGVKFEINDVTFDLGRGAYLCICSDNLHFDWHSHIDLPVKFGAYQNYNGGGMNGGIQSELITVDRVEAEEGEDPQDIIDKITEMQFIFESKLEELWKEYSEIQTDEYLIDIIEGNDLEYTEEGEIYNG